MPPNSTFPDLSLECFSLVINKQKEWERLPWISIVRPHAFFSSDIVFENKMMNSNITLFWIPELPVNFLPCSVQSTHIFCLLLCYIKESQCISLWMSLSVLSLLMFHFLLFLLLSFVLFLRLNSQPYKEEVASLIFLYFLLRVITACILVRFYLATVFWMADELFSNCITS